MCRSSAIVGRYKRYALRAISRSLVDTFSLGFGVAFMMCSWWKLGTVCVALGRNDVHTLHVSVFLLSFLYYVLEFGPC